MTGTAAVIELLAELNTELPNALVAYAVNVYAVPVVNPVNTYGEEDAV